MTYKEIDNIISSIGFPYAYYQFPNKTAQAPPFICFYYPQINDLYADMTNYQRITELVIELYTNNKDFAAEATVEQALAAAGLTYGKAETYIDSEQLYEVIYGMGVVITPEKTEEVLTDG